MSRKNIFDIVAETFDLNVELKRIKYMFEDKGILFSTKHGNISVLNYVRKEGFYHWKNRGRCVSADDFIERFGYDDLWKIAASNMQYMLLLIEIVYNFWYIASANFHQKTVETRNELSQLKKMLDEVLAHYNYKGVYSRELEQLIVIEDKPEVTAVAEITDKTISNGVLRYNHFALKGDIQAKKAILQAIGLDLEPKLYKTSSSLENDISFMLNNLNIRHNNTEEGNKYYKSGVVKMDNATLEYWYDELYQMMLLAYLQLDQIERNVRVKDLKRTINAE